MAGVVAEFHGLAGCVGRRLSSWWNNSPAARSTATPPGHGSPTWPTRRHSSRMKTVVMLHRSAYYDPHHQTSRYDRSPDPDQYPEHLLFRYGLPERASADGIAH